MIKIASTIHDMRSNMQHTSGIAATLRGVSDNSFQLGLLSGMVSSVLDGQQGQDAVERARSLALAEAMGMQDPERLKRKTGFSPEALSILRRGHGQLPGLQAIRRSL